MLIMQGGSKHAVGQAEMRFDDRLCEIKSRTVFDLFIGCWHDCLISSVASTPLALGQNIFHFVCDRGKQDAWNYLRNSGSETEDPILYYTSTMLLKNHVSSLLSTQLCKFLTQSKSLIALIRLEQKGYKVLDSIIHLQGHQIYRTADVIAYIFFRKLTEHECEFVPPEALELFDLQSVLRACVSKHHVRPCIRLYQTLSLYEDVIGAALAYDVSFAKKVANLPQINVNARRRMWLMIAKYLINNREYGAIGSAQLLNESPLSIDEVILLFPDFVVIDTFKDLICASLESHTNIRAKLSDISKTKQRYKTICEEPTDGAFSERVKGNMKCGLSAFPIIRLPFYYFPSRRAYIETALYTQEQRSNSTPRQQANHSNIYEKKKGVWGYTASDFSSASLNCPLSLTDTRIVDSIDTPLGINEDRST